MMLSLMVKCRSPYTRCMPWNAAFDGNLVVMVV